MEVPQDLRARYLERRKRDLEVCHQEFSHQNFEELAKVGHQLKGNAETYGYKELSVIGKKMEAAANDGDATELKDILHDFGQWVKTHLN